MAEGEQKDKLRNDPGHRIAQTGPTVRHITWLALGQKATKDFVGVLANALFFSSFLQISPSEILLVSKIRARCVREIKSGLPAYFKAPS